MALWNILWFITKQLLIVEYSSHGTACQSGVILGVYGASEESPAVSLCSQPQLTDGVGTLHSVQLLSSAALTVGSIRVLAITCLVIEHEMVLAGDQSLHTVSAVNILVTCVLHGPLTILPGTVADRLWRLQLAPPIPQAVALEGQHALLGQGFKDQPILAQELGSQLALLVAHVELVTLLPIRHEVFLPIRWQGTRDGGLGGDRTDQQGKHGEGQHCAKSEINIYKCDKQNTFLSTSRQAG